LASWTIIQGEDKFVVSEDAASPLRKKIPAGLAQDLDVANVKGHEITDEQRAALILGCNSIPLSAPWEVRRELNELREWLIQD